MMGTGVREMPDSSLRDGDGGVNPLNRLNKRQGKTITEAALGPWLPIEDDLLCWRTRRDLTISTTMEEKKHA